MMIGLLSGTYSSIFIASPVLALLKEREPRYQALRKRLAARESRDRSRTELEAELVHAEAAPAKVDAVDAADANGGRAKTTTTKTAAKKAASPARPGNYSANHPPRPRKKGKRR
jgi:preprotein translocase subunit SecF